MVASQSWRVNARPWRLHADELEEQRRRLDLCRLEVELEDAEAADVLHEAQKLRGAPELRLAFLAAIDQVVQRLGERIELIAAALGRRLRVGVMGELLAQLRDAGGESVRHRQRDRREHDEHVEGEEAEGEAMIRRPQPRARRSSRWRCAAATGMASNLVRIGQLRMRHPTTGRAPCASEVIGRFWACLSYDSAGKCVT